MEQDVDLLQGASERPPSSLRWLAVAAVLAASQQFAIRRLGVDGAASEFRKLLFLVTTVALMVLALRFRRYVGAWLIAAGIGLNLLPILAHGGLMPASYSVVHQSGYFPEITEAQIGHQLGNGKDILLRSGDIHFEALSDKYAVSVPVYGGNIYSLGDFVLFAGVGLVILQAVATPLLPKRNLRAIPPTAIIG